MNPRKCEQQSGRLGPPPPGKVIVVQVEDSETMEQAWQRHLQEHPEDSRVRTKIFHLEHQEIS